MTFLQELASWNPFQRGHKVDAAPQVGQLAPSLSRLELPRADRKPTVVAFLRHCGCPFAEQLFKVLREASDKHLEIHFVAVSHSDQNATNKWLDDVGGAGTIEVIVDPDRQVYGAYGLGLSSMWSTLNPTTMQAVSKLGTSANINIRPTESGSRWQTAGLFATAADGVLKYAHPAQTAEDIGNVDEAVAAIN